MAPSLVSTRVVPGPPPATTGSENSNVRLSPSLASPGSGRSGHGRQHGVGRVGEADGAREGVAERIVHPRADTLKAPSVSMAAPFTRDDHGRGRVRRAPARRGLPRPDHRSIDQLPRSATGSLTRRPRSRGGRHARRRARVPSSVRARRGGVDVFALDGDLHPNGLADMALAVDGLTVRPVISTKSSSSGSIAYRRRSLPAPGHHRLRART